MRHNGYCELGFAKLDTDRVKRRGFPEVIYAPGKTDSQIKDIAAKIIACRQALLITRLKKETYEYLKEYFSGLCYNPSARAAYIKIGRASRLKGFVLIVSAGTADIPVAEEAAVALEIMGVRVERMYDVGVAGVHRLLDKKSLLRRAKVIVVAAGMEGALASVVSGLVSSPVIALPTSVGYGANFKGLSALLTMLNSCSPGVAVVNIDNGFGAGYFAGLINKNSQKR
jgi:NCAIR mutase (PurE)-related protein